MESVEPTEPGGNPGGSVTLEAVVSTHESALLRYAARLLNNAEAAQDVVQDAFLRLHRHWTSVMSDGRLSPWLYRTTHNAAVDYIRRESRLRALHEKQAADPAVGAADPVPAAVADAREERKRLALDHLAKLDPPERQVLILRLQEGLSYREIGAVTGRTEGNVGCLLHHATKKLAQSLKQAGVLS